MLVLNEPEIPVTVIVAVPTVAVLLAVSVSSLDPVIMLGLKEAVTPLGNPEAARLTLLLNPPASVKVIVFVPEDTCSMERVGIEAESQKPGTAGPASASIRYCPFGLPHPVTRSYPVTALYHAGCPSVSLLPPMASCISLP